MTGTETKAADRKTPEAVETEEPTRRSEHWYKVEYLLKNNLALRRNASRTLKELSQYINPDDGTVDCRDDLIETAASPKTDFSQIRVQGGLETSDERMIRIVETVNENLLYSNDSIRRRYLWATQQITLLDRLEEAVERLPIRTCQILQMLYYTYEADDNNTENMRPVRYDTARALTGITSTSTFEKERKAGIDTLTAQLMSSNPDM